jgi:hypothetical protein
MGVFVIKKVFYWLTVDWKQVSWESGQNQFKLYSEIYSSRIWLFATKNRFNEISNTFELTQSVGHLEINLHLMKDESKVTKECTNLF